MPVTVLRTSNGKLDQADREKLDGLSQRLAAKPSKVVLYLHGGLVDQASAEAMATRLSSKGDRSLNAPDDWEQIYIVWRTGFLETLRINWVELAKNDRLYNALFKRLMKYVAEKVGAESPGGRGAGSGPLKLTDKQINDRLNSGNDAPFSDLDDLAGSTQNSQRGRGFTQADENSVELEMKKLLELDRDLGRVSEDIDAHIASLTADPVRAAFTGNEDAGRPPFEHVDETLRKEWVTRGPQGRARALEWGGVLIGLVEHGVKIAVRVIKRYRQGRDHGLHATIAEEIARQLYGDRIGSAVWGAMTKDAADHFKEKGLGGELIKALSSRDDHRLTLVGHSAGSIWATEFLTALKPAAGQELSLVFLAPAVRIKKFADMIDLYAANIRQFHLFAMHDELERRDVLLGKGFGFVYPSSLLYLVSGLFETEKNDAMVDAPLLGMARFITEDIDWLSEEEEVQALKKVRAFLAAVQGRIVFSQTGENDKLQSKSTSHGGFDDDIHTLKSVATYFA